MYPPRTGRVSNFFHEHDTRNCRHICGDTGLSVLQPGLFAGGFDNSVTVPLHL